MFLGTDEYKLVTDKVRASISNRLKNAGLECSTEIETTLFDNRFEITAVYIKGLLTDAQKDRALNILASEYGVKKDMIFFEEMQ